MNYQLSLAWKDFIDWISGFFNDVEKAYEKLSTLEKEVSKQASGIIAIINANLDKVPSFVWQLIQTKYPELTEEKVLDILKKIGVTLNVLDETFSGTLEEALQEVMTLLSKTPQGNTWVVITQTLVALAAEVLSPDTAIQKITFVLEYVYQHFIKGKVA